MTRDPTTDHWQSFGQCAAVILVVLYTVSHLLAAVGLIAFGLSAGGYPLNRWGIYGYAVAALLMLVLSLNELRQRAEDLSPSLLTLPPLLALWVAGLYFTTAVLWAEFAPYLDDDGLFALLNLAFALTGCGLSLGYRWPRLLLTWAGGQGVLLLTNPGLLLSTLRYGARLDLRGLPLLLVSLAYGLSALALGYRVRRRRLIIWLAPFALAGIAITVVPVRRLLSEFRSSLEMSSIEVSLLMALHSLNTIYMAALVWGLPFHAWGVSRSWPAASRDRAPGGWVWPAFLALLYGAAYLVQGLLNVNQMLPAPGEVQGWVSQSHVVPNAYPVFMYWVPLLLTAVRWLVLPVALIMAWESWQKRGMVRVPAREFPALLVWPALASLTAFLFLIPRWGLGFVLTTVWGDGRAAVSLMLMPLAVGLGLLGLARLMETLTPPSTLRARVGARALAGLMTILLLIAYLWWQGRALVTYGRVLLAPLPAWTARWQYAPYNPKLAAAIGLLTHVGLLALGLWALWRTWQALIRPASPQAVPGWVWLRISLVVFAVTLPLVGFWYWWTDPGVVEIVPPQGATDVPRDTVIVVKFKPESPLRRFWSTGQGMNIRYADTGEYISGEWLGGDEGIRYDPKGLLRPNAVVEVVFYRQGRRSFVLHFTTVGENSPTATPMPHTFGPPQPFVTPTPVLTPGQ